MKNIFSACKDTHRLETALPAVRLYVDCHSWLTSWPMLRLVEGPVSTTKVEDDRFVSG